MKEKTKEKSCALGIFFGKLIIVSFASLLFVFNCSVMWSALQNYFYEEEINITFGLIGLDLWSRSPRENQL